MEHSKGGATIKKNMLILILTIACSWSTEYLIGLSGESLSKYEVVSLFMVLYLCLCKLVDG